MTLSEGLPGDKQHKYVTTLDNAHNLACFSYS